MNVAPEPEILHSMLQGVDIPPCPSVLIEVDAELKKDAPNQREIARLISKDVSLSGHIIQLANSPYFSKGNKLVSLVQALNMLGTQQIFNLVVVQLLKKAMNCTPDEFMEHYWESSALVARLSAELAKRLRCIRPDIAYTFGLFRDCGIPLLMKRFPETKQVLGEASEADEQSFTDIEDRHLGTNHAIVGYFLAKRWRLPSDVAEAIKLHHDYEMTGRAGYVGTSVKSLIAVGGLAEHIIRLHSKGNGGQEWLKAAPIACEFLGLSLGAVDDLIEDMCDWLD